jgi:hypothetical protein
MEVEAFDSAEQFLKARSLTGLPPDALAELDQSIRQSGYAGYFRVRLKQLDQKAAHAYVSPYDRADFSLRAGDQAAALAWLEKAYLERSPYLVFLDVLRSRREFQDLIRRIGLADVRVSFPEARQAAAFLQ